MKLKTKLKLIGLVMLGTMGMYAQPTTTNNGNADNNSNKNISRYGSSYTERGITGFIFSSDQDFLNVAGPNRDANYTMGAQLQWFGPGTNSRILGFPWLLAGVDQALFTGGKRFLSDEREGQLDKFRSNFGFGVSAFTPEALDLAVPDTTDRPYASTLFIRTGRVYGSANSPWMLETSLTFDILGLHIAEFVQTAIHSGQRINDPDARPNPQGWDQQVSNGFGLSASYEATAYRPLLRAFNESGTPIKRWVTPYWGGAVSLGTYTRARGTLGLVIGRAPDTDGQSIPSMFSLDIGRAERDNAKKDEVGGVNYDSYEIGKCKKGDFQVFFDAKAHLNVWGYNALLQGLPWSDDPYTLSGSDIERLTILWNANLHIIFRTTYLRGGLGARTREFKRSGAMPHGWGTLAFGWIL